MQRIPFKPTPFDLQSNGERFALPVINSSLDCGERLWSVNLSLDGTGAVPEDSVQRSARVELLQKNSFFSRWCGDGQEGYQTHTVRPERNLFRDPLAGSPQGAQQPASASSLAGRALGSTPSSMWTLSSLTPRTTRRTHPPS